MKLPVFIAALLLLGLISCKPRKALEFKEAILQKDSSAFRMLVGKGGTEEEKLDYLIKNDFKGASIAIDRQEREFDSLIKEIEILPVEGVKQGEELKKAAADYYNAVKTLHISDREEIEQRKITYDKDVKKVDAAQDKLLQLSQEKLKMFKIISKKREVLDSALLKFDAANNL